MERGITMKHLDIIADKIIEDYHNEYDCDHDGDRYFLCSRAPHTILEEDYPELSDDEYQYVEDKLEGVR